MANITGVRTSENILQARRVVDMARDIALLEPNEAPFVTFLKMSKKNSRSCYNPKFEWLEDELLAKWDKVSAQATAEATSLTVTSGDIFRSGDILKVPSTGENMMVTAVSSNTLTVVRGYGSTTAAAITANADILNVGSAMPENSNSRTVKTTQETSNFNYTQIFRTPISLSGTEAASKLYGGKDRAYQRKKAAIEHKRDIGLSFYYGERKLDTTGDTPRRTTGGLLSFLTAASQTVAFDKSSNPLTYQNFDTTVAQKAFRYGSKEKLLIAGPMLASAINGWAIGDLRTKADPAATYGINVVNLITSYGTLRIIYDPMLEGSIYGGYGIVLDAENVAYRYMEGRDTKLNVDIQAPDTDGVVDEYITECGLEVKLPKTHMLVTGAYVG